MWVLKIILFNCVYGFFIDEVVFLWRYNIGLGKVSAVDREKRIELYFWTPLDIHCLL